VLSELAARSCGWPSYRNTLDTRQLGDNKEETFVEEQSAQSEGLQGGGETTPEQEAFKPVGTLFLLVIYILIFAAAWGMVYFNELLARR
jgi:hypothetical protein